MKNWIKWLPLAVAMSMPLTGCDKDEDEPAPLAPTEEVFKMSYTINNNSDYWVFAEYVTGKRWRILPHTSSTLTHKSDSNEPEVQNRSVYILVVTQTESREIRLDKKNKSVVIDVQPNPNEPSEQYKYFESLYDDVTE